MFYILYKCFYTIKVNAANRTQVLYDASNAEVSSYCIPRNIKRMLLLKSNHGPQEDFRFQMLFDSPLK